MSARTDLGGNEHPPARYGAGTRAELISFPSGSILKPFNLAEPPTNKFSLFEGYLISFFTGVAFVVAVLLLFVE
jgi:hypothetical protein